jgi:cytochrome c biogenesis protein CcmG, thiol:disulfide interchange protein DsbE
VSARAFSIFIAVLAVIALLGFGLIAKGDDALAVGEDAPQAELPALGGSGSGSIADYRGQWVLVNVWASWCDPCREEAPDLQRFYERHRPDGFEVLGIDTQDATDAALAFAEEFELTYPQLHDGSGDFAKDELHTTGVPENFLVDPEGKIAFVQRGPVDAEILESQIAPLIEGS